MANIFTNFLDALSGDLKDTNLKDYQHASRLFVQNFYRLAPKHGFLYFVRFRLNPNVADGKAWSSSLQDLELGMLVKKADLPKISLDGATVNIYNKKQPIYTKVTYQPINMTLWDDNKGLVREFWQMYYQYHVADSYYGGNNAVPGKIPVNPLNRYTKPGPITQEQLTARSNPANSSYVNTTDPARYGLDTSVTEPMIRSIEIYQLSRKKFFLHTLINPKIRTWNMDTVESDKKNLMEHNITIEYEGVYFGQGRVSRTRPDGFTDLHYDLDPSPIGGIFGRSDGGLLGPNGLIQDGTTLFADLQDTEDDPNVDARSQLQTILRSAKLIGNAYNLNMDLAKQQMTQATVNSIGITLGNSAVDGLVIPRSVSDGNTGTVASEKTGTSATNSANNTGGDNPNQTSTTTVKK